MCCLPMAPPYPLCLGFAGILIWVRLIVWLAVDGTGLPLPARPLGFAWWAAAATAPFTLFAPFYRGQAAAARLLNAHSATRSTAVKCPLASPRHIVTARVY